MLNNLITTVKASKTIGTVVLKAQQNSPNILFGTGVVGVVGTVVLGARATLKLSDKLEKTETLLEQINTLEHEDYSDKDRTKDKAIAYSRSIVDITKLYAPTVAVGVISIACLTQSHRILSQRNVALTAAFAGVERTLRDYRDRVSDEIGPEREEEIWQPTEKVDAIDAEGKKVKVAVATERGGSPYKVLFDQRNSNWNKAAEYNQFFISAQQSFANDLLRARGYVFLNEVHDMLGLERTKAGQIVGWVSNGDGDNYIDFGVFNNNQAGMKFVMGDERSIWLDFNVDGNVLELNIL